MSTKLNLGWIARLFRRPDEATAGEGDSSEHANRLARLEDKLDLLTGHLERVSERTARVSDMVDGLRGDLQFLKRRLSTYLGGGMALTYLADETPIFVNSGDRVSPMNLMNGGVFEEENLEVLLSYLKPEALCLDVGANLGFFTVCLAKRLRPPGRVLAFEPHPMLCDLNNRTTFINGVRRLVTIHNLGLSDHETEAMLLYPHGHLGAGHVAEENEPVRGEVVKAQLRRLDDVLDAGTAVDLVKIDVERHELQVLRGMRRVIADSPNIAILFEKLDLDVGYEADIEALFADAGLSLYAILQNSTLRPLAENALAGWSGYVMALRPSSVGPLNRARFTIYPAQFWTPTVGASAQVPGRPLTAQAAEGQLLFYGPYWFLRRGRWRLTVVGRIEGEIHLTITEQFGRQVAAFALDGTRTECVFSTDHDLANFECVARAMNTAAEIDLECVELERLD